MSKNRTINYSSNYLRSSGKHGKLQKDSNGYYELALGAFNVYNTGQQYYPMLESISEMFAPGGILRRRLDNGACLSELGHPSRLPGQTDEAWIGRVLTIEPKNVCAHIAGVSLEERKDESGKAFILAVGRIRPSGPHADSLQSSLENVEENVAFSVRCLTEDYTRNARREKHIRTLVGWDLVTEPGITPATKYNTPTLESLSEDISIDDTLLRQLAKGASDGVAMESTQAATRILTELGWTKVEIINPDTLITPKFLKW